MHLSVVHNMPMIGPPGAGKNLLAPYKSAKCQPFHYHHWLMEMRYRIETVFGQLVDRFQAKKVWARDA